MQLESEAELIYDMFLALRSPTACVLLALYSAAAVLGQGLHDWTCSDHLTCSDHEHVSSAAVYPHNLIVAAAGESSHDPQKCPICQYRAQGQLSLLNDQTIVRGVLLSEGPVDNPLPFLRPLYRPYGPRAPPRVEAAALVDATAV